MPARSASASLGHQGAVNHYLVRNLTSAEITINADFDAVFDSATPEPARGALPPLDEIVAYRHAIATSTQTIIDRIANGGVGAPQQLDAVAARLMATLIDHEYQHAKWIGEVRDSMTSGPPPAPTSARLTQVDGYWMLRIA